MIRFTSLTQRFAVWFVAVSLLPILIIGYTLLRTFENEMEKTAIRQVAAMADMKAEQIDSYLRERLLDARVIQTASTTRQAMREFAEVHARGGCELGGLSPTRCPLSRALQTFCRRSRLL